MALAAAGMLACAAVNAPAAESVVIDTATQYQTIRSWGAPAGLVGNPDPLLESILDELVYSLGLTRLRFEPPRREWEDAANDDTDPFHANPDAFKKAATDTRIARVFLPFKQRVEASGEKFEFYVSPSFFDGGSSGSAPAWLLNHPGEYAEWACAFLQYLRDNHNLHADFYSICNEAGNNNAFTAGVVGTMIKTLAPRLEAMGFRTRIQFPECVSADASWNYIQSTQNDSELWRHVGLVSYHLYGGNSARPLIRDFAWARNLPTGQTEYMGLSLNHLYDDLTLGGVATWEFYALNDLLPLNSSRTWFSRTQTYWQTRQVLRFVRPGAVAVTATTSASALRVLAFVQNGRATLVLINTTDSAARATAVTGVTPGVYGRSQTVGSGPARELGLLTVAANELLTVNLPANSTLTLYPHPGTNLPPVITDWKASPTYLTRPASVATLSASATDPEVNTLNYAWSLLGAPTGALVNLRSATSASCAVMGLTAAGSYLFQLVVSDGTASITRRLPLEVFDGNQPPEVFDVHNRLPVMVTLPAKSTTLRCAGRDLEGDPLTYEWSLVSQPTGANATLLTPTSSSCVATNLTVSGNYVFSIVLRDPTHAVSNDLRVIVYPPNRAPVISSANATPASLTLPATITTLAAETTDPDGDALSHWWSVNSAPAGAQLAFSRPGSNTTPVSGLILPGTYAFKLTVVDRSMVVTRNVAVTVNAGGNPSLIFLASPNGGETYSARQQQINVRWSSYRVPGEVKLEFFDGQNWGAIADSTPNDGIESWRLPHGNFSACRIRVSAAGSAPFDESDGPFSIVAHTPRFLQLQVRNRLPTLQFDQEPGLTHLLERRTALSPDSVWEPLLVLSNAAQTVVWPDVSATNLASAFYRLTAH